MAKSTKPAEPKKPTGNPPPRPGKFRETPEKQGTPRRGSPVPPAPTKGDPPGPRKRG